MDQMLDAVRRGPARPHLMTAAYHTPNGPLHLGHLAGPFLCADVVARHLETLGHPVARISATDSHESYILMTSRREGRPPEEVASDYHQSAADTLTGFRMPQDAFLDMHQEPHRSRYHQLSHAAVRRLTAEGRVSVEEEKVPFARTTGRGLVGAFVAGRCPRCGSGAAGSSCEVCGVWFGPGDLRDPRPTLPEDGDVVLRSVPSAFLEGSSRWFSGDEAARRFAAPYAELLETFVEFNGRRIRLNHPLGWGVPWEPSPANGMVHLSYGTGTYAAFRIIGETYRATVPSGVDPFSLDTPVVTVSTGGYDATLPWMFVMAFMDDAASDWQPYQQHIINRFLLLNGEKFSTSRGHVIWGHDYLASGLPVDPLRMYMARIAAEGKESDFRTADFASYSASVLASRWDPLIRKALRAAADGGTPQPSTGIREDAAAALVRTADHLRPPASSLRGAAAEIEAWIARGEAGLEGGDHRMWLATLAVLTHPVMPGLGQQLWACLGFLGSPKVADLGAGTATGAVRPEWYTGLAPVSRARLEALLPQHRG